MLDEIGSLRRRGVIINIGMDQLALYRKQGAEILPAKIIFTLKSASSKGGSRRKKTRIVVCGNFSEYYHDVYTSTLDAEGAS